MDHKNGQVVAQRRDELKKAPGIKELFDNADSDTIGNEVLRLLEDGQELDACAMMSMALLHPRWSSVLDSYSKHSPMSNALLALHPIVKDGACCPQNRSK